MKQVFIELLAEASTYYSFSGMIRREQRYDLLAGKALTVIGVRRSGKTTFLKQIISDLIESGVSPAQIIFLNFSDDRLTGLAAEHLKSIIEAHAELHPSLEKSAELYFFFDEIQVAPAWETFVDRLLRNPKYRVVLSGSSAKLLSKEIASTLRGRSLSIEMFPFGFAEALSFSKIDADNLSALGRGKLSAFAKSFLERGGFPETQGLDEYLRKKILQEYLEILLLRDVIERHNVKGVLEIGRLQHLLLSQVGGAYSGQKLTARLRSFGFKSSVVNVLEALDWFEDCYLFFSVPILSESVSKKNTNPRKLYTVDNGLVSATTTGISAKRGALLENLVFLELRRQGDNISYFKSKNGFELDFVSFNNQQRRLTQVCYDLSAQQTVTRELRAIEECANELGAEEVDLISLEGGLEISSNVCKINHFSLLELLQQNNKNQKESR